MTTETTTDTAAPVLTELEARRLTARIRDALALADDLLAQAYADRAWEALGHADWSAYCAAELPELRHIKLRAEPRRKRVAALLAVGASERDVASATGSSVGTAHNDVAFLRGPVLNSEQTATSPADAAGRQTRAAQVAAYVTARGPAGATVAEVRKGLKVHHGIASGALSRLHRQGRLDRTSTYRDKCAAYAAPAAATHPTQKETTR